MSRAPTDNTTPDGTHLELKPALGGQLANIELTPALTLQLEALRLIYGRVPFLTPTECASCGERLPSGARDILGVGVLSSAPVIFFLCAECLNANEHEEVTNRIYARIDAAGALLEQLNREAQA